MLSLTTLVVEVLLSVGKGSFLNNMQKYVFKFYYYNLYKSKQATIILSQ